MLSKHVRKARKKLEELDYEVAIEVGSVRFASAKLQEALNFLEKLITDRELTKAAALGYNSISSEYIFLQRMLGSLCTLTGKKDQIVSDCALGLKTSYEDALEQINNA